MKSLSPRERQIAGLLGDGKTNKEIAGRLHLANGTVASYLRNIYRKVGARNRAQAAVSTLRSR